GGWCRPLMRGRGGGVGGNHRLAAQAGLLALRAGGNAIDAAVATAATLAVVEPMMSGLGGDGFYQVYEQATGRAIVFNGSGPAPLAATPEQYAHGIPRTGPLSVSVPGTVAALSAMHRRFGRLPWRDLFSEAITFASAGFGATPHYCHLTRQYPGRLELDPRSTAIFLTDGRVPRVGTPIIQPDLARTLEEIASDGGETFYRGRLARRLAAGLETAGTLISASDLEAFDAEEQAPIAIDYRGFNVLPAPPNSTGFVLLEELKILEHFDLAAMGLLSADAVHVMVEAKKLAFDDRERWAADPRTVTAPLRELLSAGYTARLASGIDMRRAPPTAGAAPAEGDTPFFSTADGDGNAVSSVQSINSGFGSGIIAGDTGILLNNRMAYWHLDPGHPNRLRPGRRVRHTMNPPIVLQDRPLWCVFCTPVADNQC